MAKTCLVPRVLSLFVIALLAPRAAGAAATPEQQCAAAKIKASGKFASSVAVAGAKFVTTGDAAKHDLLLSKATVKLGEAFQKAEDQALAASATCPTNDDEAGVGAALLATAESVAAATSGTRFVDNGDGTITDNVTGLMWEKKTTTLGSGVNLADPHDVDNKYSWTRVLDATVPDGEVFSDFLGKLNNCSDDGSNPPTGVTGGFAGHCDWRLPTVVELQTILLAPFPCGTSPCIDPIFGPAGFSTWSSTHYSPDLRETWVVSFSNGHVIDDFKDDPDFARAVRRAF